MELYQKAIIGAVAGAVAAAAGVFAYKKLAKKNGQAEADAGAVPAEKGSQEPAAPGVTPVKKAKSEIEETNVVSLSDILAGRTSSSEQQDSQVKADETPKPAEGEGSAVNN